MKFIIYLYTTFLLYSFIGFICETLFCAIIDKKFSPRGFLCGPLIPIYGFGAIFVLFALLRYKSDPLVVFIFGMIICSALEYFTSFLLEKIFHNMWWDYSNYKYNVNGRICLLNTIMFGFGALAIIYLIEPLINKFILLIPTSIFNVSLILISILFLSDIIYSCIIAFNLRNRLIIVEELKTEKLNKIPLLFEKALKERMAKFKIYPDRLLKAFPNLSKNKQKEISLMNKNKNKTKKNKNRRK